MILIKNTNNKNVILWAEKCDNVYIWNTIITNDKWSNIMDSIPF